MTTAILADTLEQTRSRQDDSVLTLDDARAVARFFQVLADPTRVRILKALADNEWCVSDLTQALGMDQPAVSHQLKYLREMGLVGWTKTGRHVYYTLSDDHLRTILISSLNHLECATVAV
jgi:DNA-binding transcriptional ArsR family regulator